MQHLPFQPLLAQVGKDFQRGRQGVALARCEQVIALDPPGQHLRQQLPENGLRAACAHIDQIQVMRPEIREIAAFELVIALREHALQEGIAQLPDGRFIVQAGSNGVDGGHAAKLAINPRKTKRDPGNVETLAIQPNRSTLPCASSCTRLVKTVPTLCSVMGLYAHTIHFPRTRLVNNLPTLCK